MPQLSIFYSTIRYSLVRYPIACQSIIGFCFSVVTFCFTTSISSHAALPAEIHASLKQAQLSEDNLSLLIVPLASDTSDAFGGSNTTSDPSANTASVNAANHEGQVAPQSADTDRLPAPLTLPASSESLEASTSIPAKPLRSKPHDLYPPLTAAISHLSEMPRTPASTMKLIPTFIALDMLGSDFVWQTHVYHSGLRMGKHLYGDLIIQGSGDPKLTDERLRQLLYAVQRAGIRHIHGNIILDSSAFQNVSKDPAAFDNDPLRPYNASPDGFLVNFSSLEIHSFVTPSGQAQLVYVPKLADYRLPHSVPLRQGGGRCRRARFSLDPHWGSEGLRYGSALPVSCDTHTFYVAAPDAKAFAARVVSQLWSELGNTITGQVISAASLATINQVNKVNRGSLSSMTQISPLPVVSYPSYPLSELIYDINHYSNNVMTEQVTLSLPVFAPTVTTTAQLSALKPSVSTSPSLYHHQGVSDYPSALATIEHWWRTHLSTPPPHMSNGSGLCRRCTLSAANLAELLQYAYHHPEFDSYVHSLGVAGISGTIATHKDRLPSSAAIGRAWIKTGTLSNVTSMAGYIKGHSGQDYVVVGIINSDKKLDTYAARRVLDDVLDWTARH